MIRGRRLGILFLLSAIVIVVAPLLGSQTLWFDTLINAPPGSHLHDIFWRIRVPRVLLSLLGGAALAVSGLAFQAIFRNPLATPYTLGVSMGASLGAAVYVIFGIPFVLWRISGESLFAFLGAGLSVVIVYGLTRIRRDFSTITMLLAGVAVSFCFSSIILFLQYIGDYSHTYRIVRWLMGGLEVVGYDGVLNVLPFVAIGSLILAGLSRELNLLTAGEDIAASRGVNVRRIRKVVFFATSLMIGGVVSACGPIGFIGMMVPHICRLLLGTEHRVLVPASLIFGGAFLVLCDTVARVAIAPAEIPVGIITAMIGGPFFLWLLLISNAPRK